MKVQEEYLNDDAINLGINLQNLINLKILNLFFDKRSRLTLDGYIGLKEGISKLTKLTDLTIKFRNERNKIEAQSVE